MSHVETPEFERTHEPLVKVIGRLKDFGLGNPDGIPSRLARATDEELYKFGESVANSLVEPTELETLACIDGRHVKGNADGTAPVTRWHRVGGTAANLGTAFNAGAPFLERIDSDVPLSQLINAADTASDFKRSAHLGGCGGAMGEITDQKAIHDKSEIMRGVQALLSMPELILATGVDYDEEIAEKVRRNAQKTAAILEQGGWDGTKYVEGVKKDNAHGVEDLEVDENDHKYHGHHEDALLIVLGKKTTNTDDIFVWHIEASKHVAQAFAKHDDGSINPEIYAAALIADCAKHFAVADRLPSEDTPVILIAA